jgi:hypothetical protein
MASSSVGRSSVRSTTCSLASTSRDSWVAVDVGFYRLGNRRRFEGVVGRCRVPDDAIREVEYVDRRVDGHRGNRLAVVGVEETPGRRVERFESGHPRRPRVLRLSHPGHT